MYPAKIEYLRAVSFSPISESARSLVARSLEQWFATPSAANKGGTVGPVAGQPYQGASVMMDDLPGMACTSSSVLILDRAAQHRSLLWASPDGPLTKWTPHRARARRIAPLAVIQRIAADIRLRRARARSRQQLRELNDHLLKDMGLRRQDLGFEAPTPFWHCN
jgi:uncharacterized protein YjiS (DUF1127 family)